MLKPQNYEESLVRPLLIRPDIVLKMLHEVPRLLIIIRKVKQHNNHILAGFLQMPLCRI